MKEIIVIENLGKKYQLIKDGDELVSLKESLTGIFKRKKKEDFWAIRNLNFSALPGDIVGLVGPNGSGKTTLLNIISKITEPTEGKVKYRGSIGAILGANTGFHIDLNGVDNIYLVASIMGYSKREIDAKVDNIVDFAEIREFIRLPVKRLSTGMRMKLGIGIVMIMMPEILIFDEVISVIDSAFMEKVYVKLKDESLKDRLVFMVSHNQEFIEKNCNKILDLTKHKRV